MFFNQLVGLGDCREHVRDCLNANLIPVSVSPSLYPGSKAGEDDSLLKGGLVGNEGIKLEDGPAFPILFPSLGSLCDDSIVNYVPHKQEITCDAIFVPT